MKEAFGVLSTDWREGINWQEVREWRLRRAREAMARHELGAMLLMYDENIRYVTSTMTPGWNQLKPGLRYAVLVEGREPIIYEQGDIGYHLREHSPWIPKENVRYSYAWIKGAAGPAATSQVNKFTAALLADLEEAGVADQPVGVDFMDLNMIRVFEERGINWTDGMTPMMEARAIKSPNEQKAMRMVGSICDVVHYQFSQFLRPGLTENEVTAYGMEQLYNIPGMENVEDVIVSSGPNAWPNWRNHGDRIIRARRTGHHRPGRPHLERVQVLRVPHLLRGRQAHRRAQAVLRPGAEVAERLHRSHPAGSHHRRHRRRVALRQGDLGLRGGGRGRRQPLGSRTGPRPVRHSGHLPDLVARPPRGDPAGHGVRPRGRSTASSTNSACASRRC